MTGQTREEVVAGVIRRDGRVLICQRAAGDRYALKWEFPGGKVEPGETPAAALARELEEELAIRASIGPEIARYHHQYAGRDPICLIFIEVERFEGEPRNVIFEQIKWEAAERLPSYDFLEGDAEFVRLLAGGRSQM